MSMMDKVVFELEQSKDKGLKSTVQAAVLAHSQFRLHGQEAMIRFIAEGLPPHLSPTKVAMIKGMTIALLAVSNADLREELEADLGA